MNNELKTTVYNKAKQDLEKTGKIDYEYLLYTLGLEPKDLSKGMHIRAMLDYVLLLIDPDQNDIWDSVDQAIIEFKAKKKPAIKRLSN